MTEKLQLTIYYIIPEGKMKQQNKTLFITTSAVIAALYTVLTIIANQLGLANGAIQVRFSEALTVLPIFTPAAIPGLAVGCLISNILTGCIIPDVIGGTLATLLGAIGTWKLRSMCSSGRPPYYRIIPTLPPVIANTVIIPFILTYAYHIEGSVPFQMLTVGIGEIISCTILGSLLLAALMPVRRKLFPSDDTRSD